MTYYQQALDLFDLNGRTPMGVNLLINQGARSVRASDANASRSKVWRENLDDTEALLNTTFHSYKLDRQMSMKWLIENELEAFMDQRDTEIKKGKGRQDMNNLYKEVAYKYPINK